MMSTVHPPVLSLIQPMPCFVPIHFYGQLVQHDEGCAVLEKEVISSYVPTIATMNTS